MSSPVKPQQPLKWSVKYMFVYNLYSPSWQSTKSTVNRKNYTLILLPCWSAWTIPASQFVDLSSRRLVQRFQLYLLYQHSRLWLTSIHDKMFTLKRIDCKEPKQILLIFTAARYAGAVYAVALCPSVCLSVCPFVSHKPVLYQNKIAKRRKKWKATQHNSAQTLVCCCQRSW